MKLFVLTPELPFREEPPFPCCAATSSITLQALTSVRGSTAKHEGPVTVQMGRDAYNSLGPVKPSFLLFSITDTPNRADFVAGEWHDRFCNWNTEWKEAVFEDILMTQDEEIIAAIRCRRVTESLAPTSCMTDRELLEDVHSMLKQLLEPRL